MTITGCLWAFVGFKGRIHILTYEEAVKTISPGIYRHYKGNEYIVKRQWI
jgi:hypothetical protein